MSNVEITNNMKNYLNHNQELFNLDPTKFLIEMEDSALSTKEIVQFIQLLDDADIKFDINALFNSNNYFYNDKYIKYGLNDSEIEFYFVDMIIKSINQSKIITNIPEEKFKGLTTQQVHSAIKNSMAFRKIGNAINPVTSINIQLLFNRSTYEIEPCIIVNHHAYYVGIPVGVWIPKYGFMIQDDILDDIDKLNNALLLSLDLVKK